MFVQTLSLSVLYCFIHFTLFIVAQEAEITSNALEDGDIYGHVIVEDLFLEHKVNKDGAEIVQVKVYYECLCPDCRQFFTKQLLPVYQKLSKYLSITTYPYGNAETSEKDGKYEFECQHGPKECYGNMLHACAIELQKQNASIALWFNTCMMEDDQQERGSDDRAADVCGASMNIDVTSIKECARSERGIQLLKYYGDESKKIGFTYVPYVLINGKVSDGNNFLHDVCQAFKKPPQECISSSEIA